MSRAFFDCRNWKSATSIECVKAKGGAKHTTKNYLGQSVNSAKIEKPWLKFNCEEKFDKVDSLQNNSPILF